MREPISFDFDGTLTKWPPILRFLCSVFNKEQTPYFIHRPFWEFMERFPVFVDYRKLGKIDLWRIDFKLYLVSGRRDWPLIFQKLGEYRYSFEEIHVPELDSQETVAEFKLRTLKTLGIKWHFDDNRYIVSYLRKHGIRALRP